MKNKTEFGVFKKVWYWKKAFRCVGGLYYERLCTDSENIVPIAFEQHKTWEMCLYYKNWWDFCICPKTWSVAKAYEQFVKNYALKTCVLYVNGDPNFSYDGTDGTLGVKSVVDESFLFDKHSTDPLLKRTVFLSYYVEENSWLF